MARVTEDAVYRAMRRRDRHRSRNALLVLAAMLAVFAVVVTADLWSPLAESTLGNPNDWAVFQGR
jgi:uncharacterized membrane protein YidH (DUF202 family)